MDTILTSILAQVESPSPDWSRIRTMCEMLDAMDEEAPETHRLPCDCVTCSVPMM